MRQEQFLTFLGARPDSGEQGACAADIERRLGFSLDNADLGDAGVETLVRRLLADDPGLDVRPYRAALEAYRDFSQYFKAR